MKAIVDVFELRQLVWPFDCNVTIRIRYVIHDVSN